MARKPKDDAGAGLTLTTAHFAEDLEAGYELGVVWRPKEDQPVTILIIKVNGVKVATNTLDDSSPFVVRIPPPTEAGKYLVAWAISPEVPLDGIAIGIMNRETKEKVLVARSKDLKKGQLWQNTGTTVDAP